MDKKAREHAAAQRAAEAEREAARQAAAEKAATAARVAEAKQLREKALADVSSLRQGFTAIQLIGPHAFPQEADIERLGWLGCAVCPWRGFRSSKRAVGWDLDSGVARGRWGGT